MPTLRRIENELSEDDSVSATNAYSAPVSSLQADVPNSPSKDRKKSRSKHNTKQLLENERKPSSLGPLGITPKLDGKRKEARRVSASPPTSGFLSMHERSAGANQDASQAISPAKSSKKSKTESSVGNGDNGRNRNVSLSAKGLKRKAADYSDTENEGDGSNERKERIARRRRLDLSASGSDNDFEDIELELANESSLKESKTTSTSNPIYNGKAVYELQSPSDEENSDDEKVVAQGSSNRTARNVANSRSRRTSTSSATDGDDDTSKLRHSQSGSGQGGWLTSFRAKSEDVRDETDRKLDAIRRWNWLTSPSRDDKMDHLKTIVNDKDKLLQILLWDIGFDYSLYSHQFTAARFVAGFVPSFPCEMKKQADADSDSSCSDDSDDEDGAIQEMMQFDEIGRYARSSALNRGQLILPDRGMLLADEMGLGKTIEALAGAALRNATKGQKKPTLIITPQDGVQDQWLQSLLKAGVESARIKVVGEKKTDTKKRGGEINKNRAQSGEFILCTRYKIQTEMQKLFDYSTTAELRANKKVSFLFQTVPPTLIKKLRHEYNVDKGKENGARNERKEARPDRVTRLVRGGVGGKVFETVIIDECHFLRNVLAYWGIGAALLGAQAKRMVLLSGTPYNNGPKDMAALMTFIDPRQKAAQVKWWDEATKGKGNDIVKAVSDWRKTFMLRRTKGILQDKLPPRERSCLDVPAKPSEIAVYEAYEAMFISALNRLQEEIDDSNQKAQREMMDIMMACMACMRMSLIHPILPGGREVTIQFSPTRRHLLKKEEKKEKCVLCGDKYPSQKADEHAAKMAGNVKEENDEDSFRQLVGLAARARSDDNIMDDDNDEVAGTRKDAEKDKEKGPIVELGSDICHAAGSDCRHFAHERCIELFREKGCQECPRCYDLSSRIHIASSMVITGKKNYCQEIGTTVSGSKGFTASAKILMAIEWFQKVPKNEKAIILSFFKGGLDLIEGILMEDLGVECARYDGDFAKESRKIDLQRFRTRKNCRVLLASVQSGGTGLNITEANHMLFLDRWFNPQIHDQAESRCHRMGQKKDVKISYLDTSYTVDVVMKHVNTLKEKNAQVVLADGTSLGHQSSLDFHNLAGVIGENLKSIIAMRHAIIMGNAASGNADAPLLSSDDSGFEIRLREAVSARVTQKKAAVKMEDTSNTDGDSEDGSSSPSDISSTLNGEAMSPIKSDRKGNGPPPSSSDESLFSDDDILIGEPIFSIKSERKATEPTTKNKSTEGSARNCKMPPTKSVSSSHSIGSVIELSSSDEEEEDEGLLNVRSQSTAIKPTANNNTNVEEEEGFSHNSTVKNERSAKSGMTSSNISVLKGGIFSPNATGRKNPSQVAVKAEHGGLSFSNGASRIGSSIEIIDLLSEEDEDFQADRTAAMKKSVKGKSGPGFGSNRQADTSVGIGGSVHQQTRVASLDYNAPDYDSIKVSFHDTSSKSSSSSTILSSAKNAIGDGSSKGLIANDGIAGANITDSPDNNTSGNDDEVLSAAALGKELGNALETNDVARAKSIYNRLKQLRGTQN